MASYTRQHCCRQLLPGVWGVLKGVCVIRRAQPGDLLLAWRCSPLITGTVWQGLDYAEIHCVMSPATIARSALIVMALSGSQEQDTDFVSLFSLSLGSNGPVICQLCGSPFMSKNEYYCSIIHFLLSKLSHKEEVQRFFSLESFFVSQMLLPSSR